MPNMRNRGEVCPYCHTHRDVTVNLDTQEVASLTLPHGCLYRFPPRCVEELRDKALQAPFADGKTRLR
jgi:hypothetical protein